MSNPRNPQPSPSSPFDPEAGSNDDAPHDEYDPRDVADPYDTGEAGELDNRHLYRDDREPDTDYENEYPSNREW